MRISDWSSDVCSSDLFLGKQIGIFGSVWLSVRLGIAGRLRGAPWLQVYGVAMLCGIGFTMSLFIGGLEIGRASWRERVWQYVLISVVAVLLTKKQHIH